MDRMTASSPAPALNHPTSARSTGSASRTNDKVRLQAVEAARHDEAHGDVGCRRLCRLLTKVAEEGILLGRVDEPQRWCGAGLAGPDPPKAWLG
jgi:hypothetical protein